MIFLIWYQSLDDQAVTSSNLIISIFDKNYAQYNTGLCKFQTQMTFT